MNMTSSISIGSNSSPFFSRFSSQTTDSRDLNMIFIYIYNL